MSGMSLHGLFRLQLDGWSRKCIITRFLQNCYLILSSGANTDMFGRRWFIVFGSLICAIGHLIVGVGKNTNTIIAGMAITGFGAALCQMATFALTELLPNKWRHIG